MPTLPDRAEAPSAALLHECRAAWDWWERFSSSHIGLATMAAWAFAEATVWPVIPDFLLVPMAAGNRRRYYVLLAAAVLGAATGGSVTFMFGYLAPAQAAFVLGHLSLVHEGQIASVHERLTTSGAAALWGQPWSGIPFKVWGLVAGSLHVQPWIAIPTFIAARAARMAIFATLARLLTGWLRSFIRDFSLYVALIYVILFLFGWWQVSG